MLDHFVELTDREIDFVSGAGKVICVRIPEVKVCVPKVCIPEVKVCVPEIKVCDPKPSCEPAPSNGLGS